MTKIIGALYNLLSALDTELAVLPGEVELHVSQVVMVRLLSKMHERYGAALDIEPAEGIKIAGIKIKMISKGQ